MDIFVRWSFFLLLTGLSAGQQLSLAATVDGAVGDKVTFTPTNIPPPPHKSIIWMFNGGSSIVNVAGSESSISPEYRDRVDFNISTLSLELRNLTKNDAGTYRLIVATTSSVSAFTSLRLFEKVSGAVLTVPQDDLIDGISSAEISCNGRGHIAETNWMKNNQVLPAAENIGFSSDNRTMTISPIKREDAGEYWCTISNPFSSATAKTTIKVNFGPEKVQITGPKEVDEGTPVTLTCTAESTPVPSYRWDFNGTRTSVTISEYTVHQASINDSGKYTCTTANSITNRNAAATHTLDIKVGFENIQITGPKEVEVGTPVVLTCTTESTLVPSYRWDFNGTRTSVTTSEYMVHRASFNDSGNYTCTAANTTTNLNDAATHTLKIKEKSHGTLSLETIIGIASGGLVLIAGTAGVIFYFMKMRRTKKWSVDKQREVIELPTLPTEVQEQ